MNQQVFHINGSFVDHDKAILSIWKIDLKIDTIDIMIDLKIDTIDIMTDFTLNYYKRSNTLGPLWHIVFSP